MCECFKHVNEKLKDYNTGLSSNLFDNPPKAIVATYQVETGRGKKKAVAMFASHCPFCGDKYPDGRSLAPAEKVSTS